MAQRYNNDNIGNFEVFIGDQAFPCVGAKSALAKNQLNYYLADDIRTSASDEKITKELQEFAQSCATDSMFVSFVVIFQNSEPLSEIEFEHYLWERLQGMHNTDVLKYDWDEKVSSDANSPDFSMSIGGKGFYVIGLHPDSSRPARQFSKPALVFNLHSQFELLRDAGNYDRMRNIILQRDEKLSGAQNPMLAQHGQSSEARQYSGRVVEENWKCPFHAGKGI